MNGMREGVVMKQARRWLLVAAALLLVPEAAHAQKKPAKPAAPCAAPAARPQPARSSSMRRPRRRPAVVRAPRRTPAARRRDRRRGGRAAICEIDPSACPKAEDIEKAAKKTVNAEVYAVQQIYALRARRFEINPYWALTLNDQFVSHDGPGPGAELLHHERPRDRPERQPLRRAERGLGLQLREPPRRPTSPCR